MCWMLLKNVYKGGFSRQSLKGKTSVDIEIVIKLPSTWRINQECETAEGFGCWRGV